MKIFKKLGPNRQSFWYVVKNHIIVEKGSDLIAACFVFTFISGPLFFILHFADFIKFPHNNNRFGCVFIFLIVLGIVYFISAEYRGYIIIKEFTIRSIPQKPIKSYEDIIDDMIGELDEEYFSKQIEKKIKIIDAINLIKKINKTEAIDIKQ